MLVMAAVSNATVGCSSMIRWNKALELDPAFEFKSNSYFDWWDQPEPKVWDTLRSEADSQGACR